MKRLVQISNQMNEKLQCCGLLQVRYAVGTQLFRLRLSVSFEECNLEGSDTIFMIAVTMQPFCPGQSLARSRSHEVGGSSCPFMKCHDPVYFPSGVSLYQSAQIAASDISTSPKMLLTKARPACVRCFSARYATVLCPRFPHAAT